MLKSQFRNLAVVILLALLWLSPEPVMGEPAAAWTKFFTNFRSVDSGCICANGTLRMTIADSVISLDAKGEPDWNLSWEEDNSLETVGRIFDKQCGVCFVDRVVDDPKLLIAYKYDSEQKFLWETELPLSDELKALVALGSDNKGNTYVVCDMRKRLSDANSPQRTEVFKLDPKGKIKWQMVDENGLATVREPNVERNWTYNPVAFIDTTGVVTIVVGDSQVFRVFRYDANGALVWDQTSDPLGCTGSMSGGPITRMEGLPGGDVVLTTNRGTVRYDRAGACDTTFEFPAIRVSNLAAQEFYSQQSDKQWLRSDIRTYDKRGNLYIAWNHNESSDGDSYIEVCKYDPSLKEIWCKVYGENDRAAQTVSQIAVGSDMVVLTGLSYDQLGNSDGLILIYNEYGNLIHEKRYDSPTHVSDRIISALIDEKGNVYIYGVSTPDSGVGDNAVFMIRLMNK